MFQRVNMHPKFRRSSDLKRLGASHAELMAALKLLRNAWDMPDTTKAQRMRRATAWKASTDALANAAAIEDAARMSAGFGEALELTKRAVES